MLANPLVVRAYALRSVWLWLGLRAVAALSFLYADMPALPRSADAGAAFAGITVLLCLADVARRRERALLGNLAVPLWMTAAICATPAALAECCMIALGNLIA